MKNILHKLPIRWIIRLAIALLLSYFTGINIGYCLAGYFVLIFLFQFSVRLFLSLVGLALMVVLMLTLFIGLLTL